MPARRKARSPGSGKLSIGVVARASGTPPETLRTWELRYGFPEPERKPSGHRLYPAEVVQRLRLVSEAIKRGHRAGQVVTASEEELSALLETTPAPAIAAPLPATGPGLAAASATVPELLSSVENFDADHLTLLLLTEAARLGALSLLETLVAPLVEAVGERWEAGTLDIRHEHFLSERVGDLLRSLRLPAEDRASGPLVVCATLSGERHGLGLQMAALVLATAGCQVRYLGTDTPVEQVARVARKIEAGAVALSVSVASREGAAIAVARLRSLLPRRVELVVGGKGAPPSQRGVTVLSDLRSLDAWARSLKGL